MANRKPNSSPKRNPHYATKADIEHLTKSIDRIRDDNTRYIICMTLDLITQSIASQDEQPTSQIEAAVTAN